jgi:DNA-directed RNA polymerase subunit RPC12/RpoP
MTKTYFKTARSDTNRKLHADPNCHHLKNVEKIKEVPPEKYAHRGFCSACTEKSEPKSPDDTVTHEIAPGLCPDCGHSEFQNRGANNLRCASCGAEIPPEHLADVIDGEPAEA